MMFDVHPKVLAHQSVLEKGNFVTPEYILHKNSFHVDLMRRYCPHRQYPLADVGAIIPNSIQCKFHGYTWNAAGTPLNNNRQLACGSALPGESGLILKDFVEPPHKWVIDIKQETKLEYSHSCGGNSKGSWLWMMEVQTDLLHFGVEGIHPELSNHTNLDNCVMDQGSGWIYQSCETGWWVFIYPYTFLEWSPGCLSVNFTVPDDSNSEFGFSWMTQFYFDPGTTEKKRLEFETLEYVFRQDVAAIELQRGGHYPLLSTTTRLENHCVHFANWLKEHGTVKK